jgi:Activator of Hsp90 ATPase homolog 1-like protein
MPDIMHLLNIRAAPERAYQAITTAEGVGNWWTRDTVLEPKIGGMGEFGFYEGRVLTRVRVDELAPPVRVRWTVLSSSAPGGWQDTVITFDLRAAGDPHAKDAGTVLSFAHRGFKQPDEGYARVGGPPTPMWISRASSGEYTFIATAVSRCCHCHR